MAGRPLFRFNPPPPGEELFSPLAPLQQLVPDLDSANGGPNLYRKGRRARGVLPFAIFPMAGVAGSNRAAPGGHLPCIVGTGIGISIVRLVPDFAI